MVSERREAMVAIRPERREDIPSVRTLNGKAFEQSTEAELVDKLRQACPEAVSLVAEENGTIVGHILFTPAVIENAENPVHGMGLAPMAVLPERQRQGIGAKLVYDGLELLRTQNCPFVIVLGHPEYYPRFGFEVASRYGIRSQWEGFPDEAFMILLLDETAMAGVAGVARYRDEFDEAM